MCSLCRMYSWDARTQPCSLCQKRPSTLSKETYYSVKRDLVQCQKRPSTANVGVQRMFRVRGSGAEVVKKNNSVSALELVFVRDYVL
jgi:hypothetical protein